jgi:predicted aspartyl protease
MENIQSARRRFLAQSVGALGLAFWGASRTAPAAAAGRPIALVRVNSRGPFRFVFDTAATSSAVSGQLMNALGIASAQESVVTVNGTNGRSDKSLVHIDSLQCGSLLQQDLQLPLLDRFAVPVDDGLLGVSGLADKRVDIDVAQQQVSIADARGVGVVRGSRAIKLARHASGLSLIEVRIKKIACIAILDTGAEHSVGNSALTRALGLGAPAPSAATATTVLSDANGDSQLAALQSVPAVRLGSVALPSGPMTIADAHVFAALGLATRPALLLGMDRMGAVSRMVLDYRRGLLWIVPA